MGVKGILLALAISAALEYGLDPGLFCRLVERESDWDVRAETVSSVGLCQINVEAWNWRPRDPFDPIDNLSKGASILAWNMAYRGDMDDAEALAVASYTMGHGAVNKLLARHGKRWRAHLSRPVRDYVEAIVERSNYTLEALESDHWTLVQPMDLWSYQRGDCWIVGDYGPFQLFAEGKDFEEARDEFCRILIECAEHADDRAVLFGEWLRRRDAITGQSGQVIATEMDE